MLNSILILLTSMMLMGCVVTPNSWQTNGQIGVDGGIDTNVDVGVGFEPRVHIGSRSGLSVWLHPNFVVADAYGVAQNHCSRFGMYARPRRDWSIYSSSERYLDYTCVSFRPTLAFPHVILNHDRYVNTRWHRNWYHRRHGNYYRPGRSRNVYTPTPRRSPRRNGWWGKKPRSKPSYNNNRPGNVYTPKPRRSPKKNGWWGGRNSTPSKSKYNQKNYGSTKTVYKTKTINNSKPSKWSYKSKSSKNVKPKSKWSSSKKVVTKKAYSKPSVSKKKVYSVKKTVTKPNKSFSTNKVKKFEKKSVSKKKSYTL